MSAIAVASRSFPQTGLPATAVAFTESNRLLDRTAWPRLGLRGPGTSEWCEACELPFPEEANCVAGALGMRIARLGAHELLILPDSPVSVMPRQGRSIPGLYDGYRDETWSWLRMEGPEIFAALAALTSADLRPCRAPVDSVIQTRMVGLDAVLVIAAHEPALALDIFTDMASAAYVVEAITSRCPEFKG